jgi:N-hydroxyarylamine O-acetyltransferase
MDVADAYDADQVSDYLARIGCSRPATIDADALVRLHRAHLLAVPFENLDIHLGVPIELDVHAFFDKIVRRRRGGFCYELNGAFAALLCSLGFDVDLLQGRVVIAGAALGIPFDHLCLLVNGSQPMLADVGFGASFVEPAPFEENAVHTDESGSYAITRPGESDPRPDDGEEWWVLRRDGAASYEFSTRPRQLVDFTPGSKHHQTSPESHFTHNTVCSLPSTGGRLTLRGRTVITTAGDETTRRELGGVEEMATVYRDDLGVELSDDEYAVLWTRSAPE